MGLPGALMLNGPSSGSVGFGGYPGFAFSLGIGQAINTWQAWGGGFFAPVIAPNTFGFWDGHNRRVFRAGSWGIGFDIDASNVRMVGYLAQPDLFWSAPWSTGADVDVNAICPGDDRLSATAGNWAALFAGNACQTAVGSLSSPGATGNQSISGLGFTDLGAGTQPDVVLFLGSHISGNAGNCPYALGTMDAAGHQWCSSAKAIPSTGSTFFGADCGYMARYGGFYTDRVIYLDGAPACSSGSGLSGPGAYPWDPISAAFVSMDANGFTIDWTAVDTAGGTGMPFYYLAIKADPGRGSLAVGNFTQPAASVSVGFDPDGVIVAGQGCDPANARVAESAFIHVGMTDGVTQRGMFSGCLGGLPDTTGLSGYWADSLVLGGDPPANVLGARADSTLVAGGFNLNWTIDDGKLRKYGYLAWKLQTDLAAAPVATTLPVSYLTPTTVSLKGEIVPNSGTVVVQYEFFWKLHTSGVWSHTTLSNDGSGVTPDFVNATLGGLTPHLLYDYYLEVQVNGLRLPAKGGYGTVCTYDGATLQFRPHKDSVFHSRFRVADETTVAPTGYPSGWNALGKFRTD